MAGSDVGDLVRDDGGQLGFSIRGEDERAVDVEIAAGQSVGAGNVPESMTLMVKGTSASEFATIFCTS